MRSLSLGALDTFPNACLQQWFVRRRGFAAALMNVVFQLGMAVQAPLLQNLVLARGWRTAAVVGAAGNLALAPLSFVRRADFARCACGDSHRTCAL